MSDGNLPSFRCLITRKGEVLVASFSGDITFTEADQLHLYQAEILASATSRYFILHFTGTTQIAPEAVKVLTELQMAIRRDDRHLRLSGLNPEIKQFLLKQGVIRPNELSSTLNEAVLAVQRLILLDRKLPSTNRGGANRTAA